MIAYCGWLNDGPPFWQFNRIDDGHSTDSFHSCRWIGFDDRGGAQFEHHPKSSGQNDHLILYSMTDWLLELYADEVVGFKMNPTTLEY